MATAHRHSRPTPTPAWQDASTEDRRRGALAVVAALGLLLAAPAPPASAVETYPRPAAGSFVVEGRGFGHGRGMSQWGAQGAALAGRTHEQILSFYFPGSTLTNRPARTVRVRITADSDNDLRVQTPPGTWAWDRATGVGIDVGALGGQARAVAAGDGTLRLQTLTGSGWVDVGNPAWPGGAVRGPLEFTGDGSLWTYQPGSERQFRGTMLAVANGAGLTVVNSLPLENYLHGVVPREAISSWHPEALRAQAVAARSYAAGTCNAGPGYDVLDTTSCQVYAGSATRSGGTVTVLETAATTDAVNATAGREVTVAGVTQRTEFSSSNGGWTVASGPWPAQVDPYDGVAGNARHRWTGVTVPVSRFEQAYPAIGTLIRLEILARTGGGEWGGRVTSARLVGSAGAVTVTGEQLRGAGGLSSSWLQPGGGLPSAAQVAFQANTGNLWTTGTFGTADLRLGMLPGTSPGSAVVPGGYQIAFQANSGRLWTTGALGTRDFGLGMMPGTSPSITAVGGGYQIAFQANSGRLWTTGALGTHDLGLGMAAGTSPSITAVGGGYQIAFQANTGNLWTTGTSGTEDRRLGMLPGTSPDITAVGGAYQVAFQANTTSLWTTGTLGTEDRRLGMLPGTSPSLTAVPGGYQVAFQANTTSLWTTGTQGTADTHLGMMRDTGPSIAAADAGFQVAFQANTTSLWTTGTLGTADTRLGMRHETSPGS